MSTLLDKAFNYFSNFFWIRNESEKIYELYYSQLYFNGYFHRFYLYSPKDKIIYNPTQNFYRCIEYEDETIRILLNRYSKEDYEKNHEGEFIFLSIDPEYYQIDFTDIDEASDYINRSIHFISSSLYNEEDKIIHDGEGNIIY